MSRFNSELLRRHLDDRLDPESEHFLRLLNLSAQEWMR